MTAFLPQTGARFAKVLGMLVSSPCAQTRGDDIDAACGSSPATSGPHPVCYASSFRPVIMKQVRHWRPCEEPCHHDARDPADFRGRLLRAAYRLEVAPRRRPRRPSASRDILTEPTSRGRKRARIRWNLRSGYFDRGQQRSTRRTQALSPPTRYFGCLHLRGLITCV